jgi:hypothetical protein
MRRALDRVALVEVVRPHADLQELVEQLPERRDVVVDAFQEHGLAAERDAGVGKPAAGLGDFGRDLVGMREVQAHPHRVVAPLLNPVSRIG